MFEFLGSDLSKIVLCLGGFYIEISFFGCIGSFMVGFGLKVMIYVLNVVEYILINKVIVWVVYVYFFVEVVVDIFIVFKVLKVGVDLD